MAQKQVHDNKNCLELIIFLKNVVSLSFQEKGKFFLKVIGFSLFSIPCFSFFLLN